MARRYSTIKKIEKEISSADALPATNNRLGDTKFVSSEAATYRWDGASWVNTDLPFDLAIAPEVLAIQLSSPGAGHGGDWLWTWEQSTLPYARASIVNSPELSVPLYAQGTYTINNFAAYDLYDEMTQVHKFFIKWIEGAGTQNLVDWVTYSNTTATSANINSGISTNVVQLSISVPSSIELPTLTAPNVTYNVSSSGSSSFMFMGSAQGQNPNLGPWRRGGTYTFSLDNISGHPFYLTTDNGTNFVMGQYVGEYTTGVTGSRNTSGTLSITVANNAPDTLYYQCGNHRAMRGAITIKDLEVETNVNGNFIVYGQHSQEGHQVPIELRPIPSLVNQMCIVYDASREKFVPQDLATYVENTPSFKNKIKEVAGTATLIAPDGVPVVPKVTIYDDSTYLPLVGNKNGDMAFATDTESFYIWNISQWLRAGANVTADYNTLSNVPTIPTDVSDLTDNTNLLSGAVSSFVQLSQSGNLAVTTGTKRWYAPAALTISNVVARVGTAPTGSALVVGLKRNGVSNSVVSISSGVSFGSNATSISVSEGDYLTVDIIQIGSTTAGADLGLNITYNIN
jgi:hypothetical protein